MYCPWWKSQYTYLKGGGALHKEDEDSPKYCQSGEGGDQKGVEGVFPLNDMSRLFVKHKNNGIFLTWNHTHLFLRIIENVRTVRTFVTLSFLFVKNYN